MKRLQDVFAGDPDVEIIWDRRYGDRRKTKGRSRAPGGGPDRRRGERRQPPPATWTALDFIVIRD